MLPGFIFWCDYNYFNSYLDIRQYISKIFLLNLEIGVDICLIFCYNKANERPLSRRIRQ